MTYRHEHKINLDGTTSDITRLRAFLCAAKAGKVKSMVKEGTNYNRTVSIGSIEGKGDAEFVEAVAAGVARGSVEALKKSGGVP